MALPAKKYYKGAPANALLTSSPSAGDTTMTVSTVTGWPTSFPFYVVIDPGTSKEEKVRVIGISTLTLTVVRAQDNTTAVAHNSGAAVYPVFTAIEASEANEVASIMTTKGDLITNDGSTINRLAVGATNTHVLQVDSTATNGIKWGQVATNGIADGAVTSGKILDGTIVDGDISASAAVALSKLATGALPSGITVASANIVNGTIVNEDISASAAIALSKLETGALPTSITVASANIVNGTISSDDLGSDSVTTIKILNGNVTVGKLESKVPRGLVMYKEVATNGSYNTSGGDIITGDAFTAVASRYYKVTLIIPDLSSNATAPGYDVISIRNGATILAENLIPHVQQDVGRLAMCTWVGTLSAGSTTLKGYGVSGNTTATNSSGQSDTAIRLFVEDLGTL